MTGRELVVAPGWLWRELGRDAWEFPKEFGSGWRTFTRDATPTSYSSVVVSLGPVPGLEDAGGWIHASIAHVDRMPSYADLQLLHRAVWRGRGWAYQVFAPPDRHIDGTGPAGHLYALHLWGRIDGTPALPNFGYLGSV